MPVLLIFALAGGGYASFRAITPRVLAVRIDGSGTNTNNGNANGNGNSNGNDKKDFTITGDIFGLYPGVQNTPLVLTVFNPNNFDITVQSLTVSVGDAGPGCPGSQITATNFSGSLNVPSGGTAIKSLPITMVANAPQECETADWLLTYRGSAVKK